MLATSGNSTEETQQVPYKLSTGEPVNLTHLISEYVLTCGSSNGLCHPPMPPFDLNISYATECSTMTNCKKGCAMSQSCSPDAVNAYLSVSCVSPVMFAVRSWGYNMVTKCPKYATISPNIQKLCNNIGEMNDSNFFDETFRPVISKQSNFAYRNKFCAACSNDPDTIPFELELKCDRFFDINSFSSRSEILQSINTKNCSIGYVPPEEMSHHVFSCFMTQDNVSECNASGLWLYYDPQIDWACQNFNSFPYKGYKNIFCYICNPSLVSTSAVQVIDSCNVTKQWEKKDTLLERGCLELPAANRTFPFKNRFCQLCNGFFSSFQHFKNLLVNITETDLRHPTIFSIMFRDIHSADVSSYKNCTGVDKVNRNIHTANNSALMELGQFCGLNDFCTETYNPMPYTFEFCSFPCKYGENCCSKLASGHEPTESYKPGRMYDLYGATCGNFTAGDILKKMLTIDRVYEIARCNDEVVKIWPEKFSIICTKPLEASLSINFTNLSEIVYANDCDIRTPQLLSSCVSVCTNRNHWLMHNKKVLDICETEHKYFSGFQPITFNSTAYKNVFCLICTRDITLYSEEKLISKCNETGLVKYPWNIKVAVLCQNKTSYPGWYPFKNIFCAACNMESIIGIEESSFPQRAEFKPTYRIVFSLRDEHSPDDDTESLQSVSTNNRILYIAQNIQRNSVYSLIFSFFVY